MILNKNVYEYIDGDIELQSVEQLINLTLEDEPSGIAWALTRLNKEYVESKFENGGVIDPIILNAMSQIMAFLYLLQRHKESQAPSFYQSLEKLKDNTTKIAAQHV